MTLRVLIAVTHLLGAGHLTRAAALARAFAGAGHEVALVSGGMPAHLIGTGGLHLVQLPPVRIAGVAFGTLLDEAGRPVAPERLARRRELLLAALDSLRPDVVITELFPFGRRVLADEFLALVQRAATMVPRPLIFASVRDILAAPSKPGRVAETHAHLARLYDAVLVHGDPGLVPLEASWPLDPALRPKVHYTGYIDPGPATPAPGAEPAGAEPAGAEPAGAEPTGPDPGAGRSGIVVSGGSSAAGLAIARAAVAAARIIPHEPWRILLGAGVAPDDEGALRQAAPPHVAVERARPDFRALLGQAALSVSQAGYNTAVDILATGVRAVFVPFEGGHETEQRLRAEQFLARGWGRVLPEAELSPQTLAAAVRQALADPPPSPRPVARDGAAESLRLVEALRRQQRDVPQPAVHRAAPDWSALDLALSRAADQGRTPELWWRDDDVVAHTPALDRLLELARKFGIPIALAAIPARIEPSLRPRLAAEPLARALVHGLAHANHAPPGAKKAEFGQGRPLQALAEDAAAGLGLARAALGQSLLPAFVPPWNRMAPALAPMLPDLGYTGLSAVGASAGSPRLAVADVDIDPIDWHGSRSLRDPDEIVRAMAAAIERRSQDGPGRSPRVGLLTHHLVHDEAVWDFTAWLLERLSRSGRIGYPDPRDLFSSPDPPSAIKL